MVAKFKKFTIKKVDVVTDFMLWLAQWEEEAQRGYSQTEPDSVL